MGVQRYDIPTDHAPSGFASRTWVPINSPLTDPGGRVVGVLHHVEDVTAVHDTLTGSLPADTTAPVLSTLRDVLLQAARYRGAQSTQPGTADPGGPEIMRRDRLWHRVTHTARDARPGGCATALCAAAADELPGAEIVLTVYGPDAAPHQLAASSAWAQHLEELQQITGEGPSLQAYATAVPVHAPDLAGHTGRWPGFADAALGHSAAAVHAFPLRTASVTLGTLTLYRRESGPPPAALLDDARAFADMATVVLLADTDTDIAEAIATSSDDLHIAVGVLASALNISTDDAYVRLRVTAYTTGHTLIDSARATLARYLRPPDQP
ncbi:GAF and ANTAR domain-containing protein [Amycolatopsis sp. cmx-4-54]|uniref:GAF and ANTAR domain-containing protein n=1 Tax=Amycolatopsis sp. cmx-4-54 TaxID=2790936 RepID=UPI00397E40DE